MIVSKYGIQLKRVAHADIEIIRQGRNSDSVRKRMLQQDLITPQQQEDWFHRINSSHECIYFIIQHGETRIGVIHSKNIDWVKGEDEGGIFIWDERYVFSGIPAMSSIIMMQLCFSIAGLNRTYAQVHPDNTAVHQYNTSLGYSFTDEANRMVLTKESYNGKIKKLRFLASRGKDLSPLTPADIHLDAADIATPLFSSIPSRLGRLLSVKTEHK